MAFTFTPEQRDAIFQALGRSDSAAWHLTEDVEVALGAYGSSADGASGTSLGDELKSLLASVATLRAALYPLPDQLHQSGLVGILDGERLAAVGRDAERIGEALDRFSLELTDLRALVTASFQGSRSPAERFLHALGQAYRNRMNIRPTAAAEGQFMRFYKAVTDMVRRRHSDLDELCGTLDEGRLNQILDSAHSS